MKFGSREKQSSSGAVVQLQTLSDDGELAAHHGGRGRWSTAFLMVGSALLGATAIAFWNRRTLATMRAQIKAAPEPPAFSSIPLEDDIY